MSISNSAHRVLCAAPKIELSIIYKICCILQYIGKISTAVSVTRQSRKNMGIHKHNT